MIHCRRFFASSLLALSALSLAGCERIENKVKKSVVLIFYGDKDKAGSGSGFFIQGPKEVCTVLTAGHVVASDNLKISTYDDKVWSATNTQRIPNLDLAVVTFKPLEGNECPYNYLSFGNSEQVKETDEVYIAGFPAPSGTKPLNLVYQFIPGKVTGIHTPKAETGYAIAYSADTIGGNSGGPVVNWLGQVIAVHGLTDVEARRR